MISTVVDEVAEAIHAAEGKTPRTMASRVIVGVQVYRRLLSISVDSRQVDVRHYSLGGVVRIFGLPVEVDYHVSENTIIIRTIDRYDRFTTGNH